MMREISGNAGMIISQSRAANRAVADAVDPAAVRLRLIGQMEASTPNGDESLARHRCAVRPAPGASLAIG